MNKKFKKKFYRNGLFFGCTECGNCCTKSDGIVSLTHAEAENIAAVLQMPKPEFLEKFTESFDDGDTLHLKSRENGDCILLENDRCSVYTARPLQCSTFPFWPENLKSAYRWNIVSEECPGIGQGRKYSAEEIDAIKKSMRRDG